MSQKSKIIKNPMRNQSVPIQPYIPQYQLRGITPEPAGELTGFAGFQQPKVPPFAAYVLPKKPLAGKMPAARNVPYAEVGSVPFNGPGLPNVGNNIETTWSGVDDTLVNEMGEYSQIDQEQPMIDNNFSPPLSTSDDIVNVFDASQLNIAANEYVLLVKGEIISTGLFGPIQEEVRSLVFNEHPLSSHNTISMDDIIVLKRVNIKVGVFIE